MPRPQASSNKAKIARRVVEVLDYFDDDHREATVMDIVRRYDRPQSSTSELLSSLVELGLLYKDPHSRSYSLSPRAALLGASGQTQIVRDGQLVRLMDRLVAQTGLSVALFGMVGLNAQIANWRPGPRASAHGIEGLHSGLQTPLFESAAGILLLSTIERGRREGMIRRLNAEAADDRKFSFSDMVSRVDACMDPGHVCGAVGYGGRAEVVAQLLPGQAKERPMAVGFVYSGADSVNSESLLACLKEAMDQCFDQGDGLRQASVSSFPNAA
jgi:DNA-binding IclR family transcriptional regulator